MILLRNSHIAVTNYELGDCQRLEFPFKLYDRLTHSYSNFGMDYDEEDKTLYLGRNIDVWFTEQCLDQEAVYDRSYNRIREVGSFGLKIGPRNDRQKEILRFMLGKEEYQKYDKSSGYMVAAKPGFGKTYLSIATSAYYEYATIVITYSNSILKQWIERVQDYCKGVSKRDLCLIEGGASINRLLKSNPTHKMYFVTHSTIQTYASANGWNKIGDLFAHLGIGVKIIDEAHLNFLNMTMIDFHTNVWKTYYLTGTPARSSEDENKIYAKYFKNIPTIDLFDDAEDKHTAYTAIKFNSHPTIYDLRECKGAYGLDRNKYINYLINRPVFYQIARIIVDLAIKANGKCLIYIGTNAAIGVFYNWFVANYHEHANDIGIYTTLSSKEEKEYVRLNKRFILSTTKSAGAAVDISGLKLTIVLNEPFKSQVTAEQSFGRTRDDNTFYIECVDKGFKDIVNYNRYKRPIFEKMSTSFSEINLSDSEINNRCSIIMNNRRINHSIDLFSVQRNIYGTPTLFAIQKTDTTLFKTLDKFDKIELFSVQQPQD